MNYKEISDEYLSISDKLEKIGHLIVLENYKKACFILGSLHSDIHNKHIECLKLYESSNNFKSKGLPNDV